jgi:hypothetical protein
MTTPYPPAPAAAPFGFGTLTPDAVAGAQLAPAPAAPVADPVPAGPVPGAIVQWTEYDVYDELHPERVRYGIVVGYDAAGAAQVLALGESRQLGHFAPVPTTEGPHGPTIADLTALAA